MDDFQKHLVAQLPNLMASPAIYPHTLDMEKGQALMIGVEKDFYRQAIFLDNRVLRPEVKGAWLPLNILWDQVAKQSGERMPTAHFIFHTGHSGSTLISRLLDEISSVLGLREPLPLRTMAIGYQARESLPSGAFSGAFIPTCKLLARRFGMEQQVIIKATSMCNNLSGELLKLNPANRGLFLYVPLESYLANMLDKEETPDIEGFLGFRLRNLAGRLEGQLPEPKTRAEKTALSWLSEVLEMASTLEGDQKPKSLAMSFENFLLQKDIHLELIFKHFSLPGRDEALGRMLASPVFKGYAKQPDFDYSAETRAQILAASKVRNADEIQKSMQLVENLAAHHSAVAKTLKTFKIS